jgi:phosphate transport system protein
VSKHLERDLERLKREILVMGALAEDAMRKALDALFQGRQDLASEVIRGDGDLDLKEVEVEEECLKILALHQPVAADLRFIVAVLKVNNDLERMGDLAQSIAERAQMIGKLAPMAPPATLHDLADRVRMMVKRSLDALVRLDPHHDTLLFRYNYPWHRVRSFRNLIVHDYYNIRMEAVWQIIIKDVPDLQKIIASILKNEFE